MRQGVRLEPLLEAISKFLDSQHEMVERVRRDLVGGLKKPRKGRRGLTARQVLRSLVLMRVKNWDYRELRERIADGVTLRQFTDFYCDPVPKHDAFNRGFNRLTPRTLKAVNDLVVQAAVGLGLEDGAKLRSTPRWSRPTSIIRPTTPCYGTLFALSPVWWAALPRR
jgi:transposase, IS5 family